MKGIFLDTKQKKEYIKYLVKTGKEVMQSKYHVSKSKKNDNIVHLISLTFHYCCCFWTAGDEYYNKWITGAKIFLHEVLATK